MKRTRGMMARIGQLTMQVGPLVIAVVVVLALGVAVAFTVAG